MLGSTRPRKNLFVEGVQCSLFPIVILYAKSFLFLHRFKPQIHTKMANLTRIVSVNRNILAQWQRPAVSCWAQQVVIQAQDTYFICFLKAPL